jgi:glycosyltransferase involved in cell wall biosynthesis
VRVLHVGKFYPPVRGGMETVLASLCEGTARRWGVRAVVAHDGTRTVRERRAGVEVVRVGTLARALSVALSPGLARELWRERFDCVVLHEPNPPAGTLLALHTPAPHLVVWHHSDIVRPAWADATYGRVQRALYRRAARVIVAAPPLAASRSVADAARRVDVVPYGIALDPLLAAGPSGNGHLAGALDRLPSPRVLFVGRLVYYKGLHVLLEAVAATRASLVIAGDGPLQGSLRERVAALGLTGRVGFFAGLTDEDVRRLYRACDIFVLPSTERTEAFGLVQVEAMASGLPVVSTDLPTAVPWVNEHGVTGLVVRRDDAAALAGGLERLVADPGLRAALGQAGRRRAIERFSVDRMVDDFVAIVESVTGVAR